MKERKGNEGRKKGGSVGKEEVGNKKKDKEERERR